MKKLKRKFWTVEKYYNFPEKGVKIRVHRGEFKEVRDQLSPEMIAFIVVEAKSSLEALNIAQPMIENDVEFQ